MKKQEKKNSKTRFLIPLLLLAIIAGSIVYGKMYFENNLFTVMQVPDFTLTDQNGKKISNKDMLGKVYVVEFFFSTCPTICPIMNTNMRFVEDQINDPNFGIISISIDPEHDTPEILKKHAHKIGAKSPNWHFLTGDRTYIGNLADEFEIYVGDKEDDAESLNHSGMFALVDKKGNLRCRYDENNKPILYYSGLNYEDKEGKNSSLQGTYHPDRQKLIEDIQKLLRE